MAGYMYRSCGSTSSQDFTTVTSSPTSPRFLAVDCVQLIQRVDPTGVLIGPWQSRYNPFIVNADVVRDMDVLKMYVFTSDIVNTLT